MRSKLALVFLFLALGLWAAPRQAGAEISLPPERACKLLRAWSFKPGDYARHGDWHVCEAAKSLTNGKLPNTLCYQVVGSRDRVQELRLELSVDDPGKQGAAKNAMIEAALHMARKLGAAEPPDGLEEAMRRGSEGRWEAGRAIITLVRHPVPDPPRGYKLILTAR
jgi:hypothetical protein